MQFTEAELVALENIGNANTAIERLELLMASADATRAREGRPAYRCLYSMAGTPLRTRFTVNSVATFVEPENASQ